MFYVYVLFSFRDHKLYYGYTTDLRKRINEHNAGLNTSTKNRRPLKLIYYEAYISETDAKRREKFLKTGRGREVLKKHLEDTLNAEMAEVVKARV